LPFTANQQQAKAFLTIQMKIGTIKENSLIDYPGKISAVIGTQGCNMRCFWCHNSYLIPYDDTIDSQAIDEVEVLNFLIERKGFLDGIVITGGEPTIHPDLPGFCEKIKKLGFPVKLDTNGTNHEMLNTLINDDLVDYIAMDVKTDLDQYRKLFRESIDLGNIIESIKLILDCEKPYEFRTTCVSPFVNRGSIAEIGTLISGARQYYLQKCNQPKNTNGNFNYQILIENDLTDLQELVVPHVENCKIR
jgi:pyruvate formate lyase activating enzyme